MAITASSLDQPDSSPLPPLYAVWMHNLLAGEIPPETKSTCSNCAMAAPANTVINEKNANDFFDPDLKCCTFLPTLPNFLVGRILSDDDPASEAGRATVHTRICAGLAVTPLGLGEPALQALIYAEGAKTGFGRSKSLLCPHYLPEDGGKCGVWKNRNAVCVTWFCKHERGATGKTFWTALQQLLVTAEKDLAAWCVAEMGLNEDALKLLFPPLQPSSKDPLTASALDRRIDPQRIQAVWGEWRGREHEFYLACARLVDALTWADVLRVCGPSLRIQAKLLTQTYHALMNKQLPPKLKLNELKIAKLHGASMQLSTYSTLDPLQMPSALLAALPHFDGRAVDETVAEVIEQKKLRLTPSVLQKLVDFGILVPPDNSANKFIKP
jgi:hypothetical protein